MLTLPTFFLFALSVIVVTVLITNPVVRLLFLLLSGQQDEAIKYWKYGNNPDPKELEFKGFQHLIRGENDRAESCYLRSIAGLEAWCRRNYGDEPRAAVKRTISVDDCLERFQSIFDVTEGRREGSSYSVMSDAANIIHVLAIIQAKKGFYREADALFRAALPHLFDSTWAQDRIKFLHGASEIDLESNYKLFFQGVCEQFGRRSPYAATMMEYLAPFCEHRALKAAEQRELENPDLTEAQLLYREAIAIRQQVSGGEDPKLLRLDLKRLESMLIEINHKRKAEPEIDLRDVTVQLAELSERENDIRDAVRTWALVATRSERRGDYGGAAKYLERAVATCEKGDVGADQHLKDLLIYKLEALSKVYRHLRIGERERACLQRIADLRQSLARPS